jgi:23S rRNA (pseudouridine1915-N3)-methyltransferase
MQIKLLTVGNVKEKYWKDACSEYMKRLQAYAKVKIVEVAEENKGATNRRKQKEGEQLLKHIGDSYVIALAINGKTFSSEQFASKLDELGTYGKSHVSFIIGGSDGLADEVLARADLQLSFSTMTFPHQLMRVILLEQIYRAYKIIRNETYHK